MHDICSAEEGGGLLKDRLMEYTEGAKKKSIHILRKEKTSAIFFNCPVCRMVTLAFIWLTPSYYALLP